MAFIGNCHSMVRQHMENETPWEKPTQCVHTSVGNETEIKNDHDLYENLGEFDWDEETQALVIGSFFWGYTLTQVRWTGKCV